MSRTKVERKIISFLAVLGLALALSGLPGPAAAEPRPSSDVLVPYFEVALDPDELLTTLFSVNNSSDELVEVSITVQTNWGIPVIKQDHILNPDEVHTVNLRDWLVEGRLLDRVMTPEELSHVQAALSGKPSPRDNHWYGTEVAPGRAVGYVTIRTSGARRADVLWGDYFHVGSEPSSFQGDTLVNIDFHQCDVPCKRHAIRFLEGAPFEDGTELVIWTDKRWAPSPQPEPLEGEGVKVRGLAFDEPGRFLGRRDLSLRPVQVVRVSELALPEEFGWLDLATDRPSFIGARFTEGPQHASSALHSYCLDKTGGAFEGPEIQIRKRVNGQDANESPGPSIPLGSELLWEYEVANTGSVDLTGISVADDTGLVVTCPRDTLKAAETMVCTASGVAEACEHFNLGTVTATAPDGSAVNDADLAYYTGSFRTEIQIENAVNGEDADLPPGPSFSEGAPLQWTFTVTNSGEVALTEVSVTDSTGLTVTCPKTSLEPGETMTCTASSTAVAGASSSVAVAQGKPPCGPAASASDPSYYHTNAPSIDLEKLTNGQDADLEPGPSLEMGSPVAWSYVVTNTGNVALVNVSVTDDQGVQVTCPQSTLQPGQAMTCTGSGVAQACQYGNLGTAMAEVATEPGRFVKDQDSSHYFGRTNPRLAIEKKTEGQDADAPPGPDVRAGSPVHWTYVVTNFGDVPLTGIVVADDYDVVVTCPKTALAPEESMTCTGSGTAMAGQYRNVGLVSGTPPCGPVVTATDPSHYYGRTPGIGIEKLINGQEADNPPYPILHVGDPILWTFVVTNTGDVALTQVTVTDSQDLTVACPKTTLVAGESMTCVATGSAASGAHSNTGTATGEALGTTVTASDPANYVVQAPAISLEKQVNGNDADTPPGPTVLAGSPVTWTFVVTNTGDVQLTDVVLTDNGTVVACPQSTLAPGGSMTCSTTGTAVHGQSQNTASVVGTPPAGPQVTASDPAYYRGVTPGISLEKLVNGQDADTPPGALVLWCSTLQWTYLVTNTGEVALENVSVVDDQENALRTTTHCQNPIPFLGVSCPKTTLAVGESMACTATSTAETVGQHLNTATAQGTPVLGGGPVSDQDPAYYTAVNTYKGCTPGYWKNHPGSWPATGYTTSQSVQSVFVASVRFPPLASATLLQALAFSGGSSEQGAAEILLRAGVAALLNAAHPSVPYPRTPESVITDVNAALGGSRDQMLALAASLDADNNRGCPLN